MTAGTLTSGRAARRRGSPTATFYLLILALLWVSNLYGFGRASLRHLTGDGPAYLPIVHVHALFFVGWMALMTGQVALVRAGRVDLHRRIGGWMVGMAAAMVPLGIATAFLVDATKLDRPGFPPGFFFLQIADMALFALTIGWAYAARRDVGVHKRLMMLATINLSTAGFGRWAASLLAPWMGASFAGEFATGNLPVLLLIAAMMLHDLTTGGLHRVWPRILPIVIAVQLFQTWVTGSPAMNDAARRILSAR